MRSLAVVLATAVLSCLLAVSSAYNVDNKSTPITAQFNWAARDVIDTTSGSTPLASWPESSNAETHLAKRAKSTGLMRKAAKGIHWKRKRPFRESSSSTINDEVALKAAIRVGSTVALHSGAIGVGLLPPAQSAATAVGYLGLHVAAAGLVAPIAYHATKGALEKAKTCLGPYCKKLYEGVVGSTQVEQQETSEVDEAKAPEIRQMGKKGGRRNTKAMTAAKTLGLAKRGLPSGLKRKEILQYGHARKRLRPYKMPSLPPITGPAAFKATALTASSVATHAVAIRLGLVSPIESIPMGVATLSLHGIAAGLVAPLAYRASRDVLEKAKECLGPNCRKMHDTLVGYSQETTARMQQKASKTVSGIEQIAKKGGRRNAKVLAARTSFLVKRSLVDASFNEGIRLEKRTRRYGTGTGLSTSITYKHPKSRHPRSKAADISTQGMLRTLKWAGSSALGHTALVTAGTLPPIESGPAFAGAFAFHTIAAGVVAPLVYDAAKQPMRKVAEKVKACVGPHCQRMYDRMMGTAPPQPEKLTTPTTPAVQRSKKGGRRNAKGLILAKRSLIFSMKGYEDGDLVKRGSRGNFNGIKEGYYEQKTKVRIPQNGPPSISAPALLRAAGVATTTALSHGALIAAGALPPIQSAPALAGTLALHASAAAVLTPLVYSASKKSIQKVTDKVKDCIGAYCQKLVNENADLITPSQASKIRNYFSAAAAPLTPSPAHGSTKKASRKAKAVAARGSTSKNRLKADSALKKRSSSFSLEEVRLQKRGSKTSSKSHLEGHREGVKIRRLKVSNGPPPPRFTSLHLSDRAVASGVLRVGATLSAESVAIAAGLSNPIRTPNELAFTVGKHIAVSGFGAPLLYQAGSKAINGFKKCVGPYCTKLYEKFSSTSPSASTSGGSQSRHLLLPTPPNGRKD